MRWSVDDPKFQGLLHFVGAKFMVGLTFFHGPTDEKGEFVGKPGFYVASGFAGKAGEHMVIMTAGHAVQDANSYRKKGHGIRSQLIIDDWFKAFPYKGGVPFDWLDHVVIADYVRSEGVDYAVVLVPDHFSRLMNQTVHRFDVLNWAAELDEGSFNGYFLHGLPNDGTRYLSDIQKKAGRWEVEAGVKAQACFLSRQRSDEAYGFCATIVGDKPNDIGGMSGGLILGLKEVEEDVRATPVAIQSMWKPEQRVVYGTPLTDVIQRIAEVGNTIEESN